jgi:hypothetical protein
MSTPSDSDSTFNTSPAPVVGIRPVAITVVCLLGFVGAAGAIWILASGIARQVGAWYPPFLAFSSIGGAVSFVGLWMMRRWGVILYSGLTLLSQVVLLLAGRWNLLAVALPGIVIAIGFGYFSRMR